MSNQITWINRLSSLFIAILLLLPLDAFSPLANPVSASQPQTQLQQTEVPIDYWQTGDRGLWINPETQSQSGRIVGNADGPDVSPPGEIVQVLEEFPMTIPVESDQVPKQSGILDLSLPENQGLLLSQMPTPLETPTIQADPIQMDPGQDFSLEESNLQQPEGNQVESLTTLTGNLDDFNRANGPLGGQWSDIVSGFTIQGNSAATVPGAGDRAFAVHKGIGTNQVMARVINSDSDGYPYAGIVLNYTDGVEYIFIKVQDNDSDGLFDSAACYTSNSSGVSFGLGFFFLSGTFSEGTLKVTANAARTVTIELTDLVGGSGNQSYICNGAPIAHGGQLGIVAISGGRIDNVTVEAVHPVPFSNFNEQDGPLGPNWWVRAGEFLIAEDKASSPILSRGLATYNSLGSHSVEADVSLSPGGFPQYSALVLNFDEGANNLFLKVQDNDGINGFDKAACYLGNNNSSAPFGLGFFDLSAPFNKAHMKVSVGDDRIVSIELTHIDGGSDTQVYACAGAPPAEGYGVGIASWQGGQVDNFQVTQDFEDDFNRADGTLGSSWTERAGNFDIVSQKAKGITDFSLATVDGPGSSMMEADVALTAGGNVQYSALLLDYGAGASNLFLKVQDNNGDGLFDTAGCYTGNNNNNAMFGLGFYELSGTFATAHMEVSVDSARVVTMAFSSIDGGNAVQVYVCEAAPAAEGSMVGIGSHEGGLLDNVRVNRIFGYDPFNRSNGALGPSWQKITGTMALVDQKVLGTAGGSNLTIFSNVTGNQIEGDISANPSGALSFSAFILNYGTGNTNLFIKFQNGGGDTMFESIGCYIGNNINGFGPGYFSMTAPISTAHVKIAVNSARTVTILLTRIDGGTGTQVYTCAGAPPTEGSVVGIASLNGGLIDSVMAGDYVPMLEVYLPVITR